MGSEATDKRVSPTAVVAAAAVAVTLKQAMEGVDPANGFSLVLGAGMVLGYLAWRRRQDAPGQAPTGPASGAKAWMPAAAAIVVGLFCLLHWFVAFVIVTVCVSVVGKRLRAGERSLSQALGELLLPDAAPTPVVQKAAAPSPTRKLKVDRPVVQPPAPPPPPAVEADERAPLVPVGFAMPASSVLDSRPPLELESRVPLVLETRLSALTSSLGTSSGTSGFDEALALLQSKPAADDRAG